MAHRVMNNVRLVVVAAISVALAGCAVSNGARPLAFAPGGTPQTETAPAESDAILDALNGGILPRDAAGKLSRTEQLRALEAEYQALEKTPLGQKVTWASPVGGASGEVTAGTPYQVGQQNCRQYTHVAVVGGAPVTGQGAACRNPDGSWTPLS